jgi:hypothetical protein
MFIIALFGAVGGFSAIALLVGAVRYWLAHRPIRVSVAVQLQGPVVFLAVTSNRGDAQFEGKVIDVRGAIEQVAWPWSLKWRHSILPAERITKNGMAALLRLAEAYAHYSDPSGVVAFEERFVVLLADPAGQSIRLHASDAEDPDIEVDVEIFSPDRRGRHPTLTVGVKFNVDGDWRRIVAKIRKTTGIDPWGAA